MRQLALTPRKPPDGAPPKQPASSQDANLSPGADSADCKTSKTSALATPMLPHAGLQPAALSQGLATGRRRQESRADRADLPLSGIRQTKPAQEQDFQRSEAAALEAAQEDSWQQPAPVQSQSASTPDPDESWTWKQDAPKEARNNRAARQEESEEEAGSLGRLDQAVQSDLLRARSVITGHWERLRSKWTFVKNPRIRRLRWVAAAAAVVLFTPVGGQLWSAAEGGMEYVGDESRTRAAFQFVEDFQDGVLAQWDAAGLAEDETSAAVRAESLTLFQETMDLSDYFMDFDFVLDRPSVGWVVRALDRDSYCAFKLERTGPKNDQRYKLVRYAVVDGDIDPKHQIEIDVTSDFRQEGRNRISVRIAGARVNTFLNGRGVDFWNDKFFHQGGVGFWNEDGSSGQIHRVAVYGNEDFWGLTLFAARETAHRVKQIFSGDPGPQTPASEARM